MRVVEVKFDLTNPNQKPIIAIYEVEKQTERYFHTKKGICGGRMFYKQNMNHALYHRKYIYRYAFVTLDTDCEKILSSDETKEAIRELRKCLQNDLNYYQRNLDGAIKYYESNHGKLD